ncbi:MAG: hypothetical protein IH591_07825, partial [Bacteroidales bacterium]|nr:hypothetical protein [Bacteroidales bacterium]
VRDMSVISTLTGLNSPRYLLNIGNDIGYISDLYSDSITILNTKELRTTGFINLGRSSEMMARTGSKVYVASWSGDSVITVISSSDHTISKTITVGMEPESLVLDKNGILWVLCSGGYMGEELPSLSSVDTNTDVVLQRFTYPSGSYPTSLNINYTGDTLYYINGGVYRMSVEESKLPQIPFIAGTNRRFYRIEPDARKGCIFVTDAGDYQRNGYLLEYSTTGVLRNEFEVGIIPGSMASRETYIADK